MIESLETIRALKLAPVFEDLYHGKPGLNLALYFSYPTEFHEANMVELDVLIGGRLIPIVADAEAQEICLFDPLEKSFVTKSIEQPQQPEQVFTNWQQFLATKLLEIADSGASDEELSELATEMRFSNLQGLLRTLAKMDQMSDREANRIADEFVASCE